MAEMKLGELRPVLDGHEKFALEIRPVDPGFEIAQEILGLVASARESLKPSSDSTANFIQNRDIIEQLAMLRMQAEILIKSKSA